MSSPVGVGNAAWDVKRVLGVTEVYPDGSAFFKVPARRPLYFQALDENGQEIQLTGEGELAQCFCHELDHLDGIVFLQRAIKTSPAAPSKGRRRQNRKA